MNASGILRWTLIAGALCLAGETPTAVGQVRAGHASHHRHPRPAGACRCDGRHGCARKHAKAAHKRRRCKVVKRSTSHGVSGAPAAPTPSLASPMPGAPGAAPATGASSTGPTAVAPPAEAPASPPAPAHVEVTAEDSGAFRFVLSRPTVPAGKVIVEFVNHGQDEHNLNAIEPNEGSLAGSIGNTVPNAHPSLTVNLRAGSYTLFCSIADHEAKGMKATLVVD